MYRYSHKCISQNQLYSAFKLAKITVLCPAGMVQHGYICQCKHNLTEPNCAVLCVLAHFIGKYKTARLFLRILHHIGKYVSTSYIGMTRKKMAANRKGIGPTTLKRACNSTTNTRTKYLLIVMHKTLCSV